MKLKKTNVLDDFFVDGRLKVGLKKGKNKRFFYELLVKKIDGSNLRLFFSREDEEFVMDLYNIERFFKPKK